MIGVGGADRDRTDDLFNAIPYSTLPASVEPGKLEQRELSPVALLLSPLAEALPHYYQDPDFSPRLTEAFRSLPYSLAYPSGSSALPMNTLIGNTTRSPQVRRFSFSPCRPHIPCLGARCASISFALELQARLCALLADRFAACLSPGYGPEFRRMPFGFHLAVDTLPSL